MGKLSYIYGKVDADVCNDLMKGKNDGDFCFRTLDTDGEYCLHLNYKGKCTRHKVSMINGNVTVNKKAFGSPKTIEEAVKILKTKQPGFPIVFKEGIGASGKEMGLDYGESSGESAGATKTSSSSAKSAEPVIVVVGSSTQKTKVVDLPEDDLEVSPKPLRENSRETFKVEVKGRKLTVTRVDQDKGWIQNLRLNATPKAAESEPEPESKRKPEAKKEEAASAAAEPEPEPEPEPTKSKPSDDPFFTFADEIDAIIAAVSGSSTDEPELAQQQEGAEVVDIQEEKRLTEKDLLLKVETSKASDAQTGGEIFVQFELDGKWLEPQSFFKKCGSGEVKSKKFAGMAAATQVKMSIKSNDAFGYWRLSANGKEVVKDPKGISGRTYQKCQYWIDGNEKADAFNIFSLPDGRQAIHVTLKRPKGGSLGLSFHGDEKNGYFVTKLKSGFTTANPEVSAGMRILSVAGKDVQGCERRVLLGLFVESGQSFKASFCEDLAAFALFRQNLLIEEATTHKKDGKLHAEILNRAEAGRAKRAGGRNLDSQDPARGMGSPKKSTMFDLMVGGPPTPAAAPVTRQVAQVAEDGFPPGWRSAVDKDGRTYFLNDITLTTTYHDPRLESSRNHSAPYSGLRTAVSASSVGSYNAPRSSGPTAEGSLEQHPARVLLIQRRQKRDHVGFGLAVEGATLVVKSILDVGAAFEAGIRVGDRIIGVDGRPARGEPETMKILHSKLKVSIAVSSNDAARPRPRVLYLTRASKQERLGLQFYTEGGVCMVEDVPTTGIAYKTGLRVGDHIAAVNGKWPKKNVTQEKILKLFAKSPACFTVTTRPLLAVSRRRMAGSVRMANRPKT